MSNYVVGIDVGGRKKGFHAAFLVLGTSKIDALYQSADPADILDVIRKRKGECLCIAVDAPPKATINGPLIRSAERALREVNYRLQYTRRVPMAPQEWMTNGEKLWTALLNVYPRKKMIETFPTATCDGLTNTNVSFDFKLFNGKLMRKHYKDFIDACLCAITAEKYLEDKTKPYGVDDELGPIHVLVNR